MLALLAVGHAFAVFILWWLMMKMDQTWVPSALLLAPCAATVFAMTAWTIQRLCAVGNDLTHRMQDRGVDPGRRAWRTDDVGQDRDDAIRMGRYEHGGG